MKNAGLLTTWFLTILLAYFVGSKQGSNKTTERSPFILEKKQSRDVRPNDIPNPKLSIKNADEAQPDPMKQKKAPIQEVDVFKIDQEQFEEKFDRFLGTQNKREQLDSECQRNVENSCFKLDQLLRYTGKIKEYQEKSISRCLNGVPQNCDTVLGQDLDEETFKKVLEIVESRCEKENPEACQSLGYHFSVSERKKINKRAEELLTKACELDPSKCSSLAYQYLRARDSRAGDILRRLCENEESYHCSNAASFFFDQSQPQQAEEVLRKGCEPKENFSYSCDELFRFLSANNRKNEALTLIHSCHEKSENFYCKIVSGSL